MLFAIIGWHINSKLTKHILSLVLKDICIIIKIIKLNIKYSYHHLHIM
jgi:hypothetical protein